MKLPYMDALGSVGLVGERKALALLFLGFYTTLFFMIGLSARTELPEWVPVFSAMTLMYCVTFFGVAAEWFWGRWFATGLGYWGLTMTAMAWVTTRSLPPAMIIFGGMHALIAVCLQGEKMAVLFDAKPDWRARWKLDDQGVIRVRKSVTRAASSLPALIMFALAPRQEQELLAAAAFAFGIVGFGGVLLNRTYGVIALTVAALATAGTVVFGGWPVNVEAYFQNEFQLNAGNTLLLPMGAMAAVMLGLAALPFLKPMAGFVFRRR